MPDVVSHGLWLRGPDAALPGGGFYQTFARRDGRDWYAHAHAVLVDGATRKAVVRDGVVALIDRDGTRLVPPGEVLEIADGVAVEAGWRWDGARFTAPKPAPSPTPIEKLAAFLRDNPDVEALLR